MHPWCQAQRKTKVSVYAFIMMKFTISGDSTSGFHHDFLLHKSSCSIASKTVVASMHKKHIIDDQLFPSFFHNFLVLFQAKTINSTEDMLNECHWILKRFASRASSGHIETIEIIHSKNGEIPQDHSHTFVSFQWSETGYQADQSAGQVTEIPKCWNQSIFFVSFVSSIYKMNPSLKKEPIKQWQNTTLLFGLDRGFYTL